MLLAGNELSCGVFDSTILRSQRTRSRNRRVACFELEVFHTDSGVSYINGTPYPVRRGMLLCAKPGSIRCSDFPVRCSFIRVFPVRGVTEDVEKILRFLPDCVFPEDDDLTEVFLTLFARLGSCLASSSPDACDLLKANSVFLEILSCYMSACAKSGRAPAENLMYSPAREVCEYINGHFASDCSLKKLAEIVHLSPNHLHTVFKASVGMTPYEYTVAKRIDRAGTLIMTGEKSMLDIALETGFCSQSHFNKVFKEKTGLTPAEYRKKIWDRY